MDGKSAPSPAEPVQLGALLDEWFAANEPAIEVTS